MEHPEGCTKTLLISFIENEELRPDPEYKWLIHTKRNDQEMVTCRMTFEDAIKVAEKELLG